MAREIDLWSWVVCVDDSPSTRGGVNLTPGKKYRAEDVDYNTNRILVKDNMGFLRHFRLNRFELEDEK